MSSIAHPPGHSRRLPLRLTAMAVAAAVCAGCATPPAPAGAAAPAIAAGPAPAASAARAAAPASAASAASGAASAAVRPDATAPRPFAEVIKDAKRSDGFFPVWRQDEKVWLEIPAERIGKPFLLTVGISNSVGERGLYASSMRDSAVVEWRQIGRTLQLVERNKAFRADGDAAMVRTVKQAFSDSLLASAPVASAPHPERKSVLVDASFLQADLPAYSTSLEMAYRLPYSVDKANSYFDHVRASERQTSLGVQLHFATPRIPASPLVPPPPGTPRVPLPSTLPDLRSLFVGVVYNLAALPDTVMAPRAADSRIGHFTEAFTDLSTDTKPRTRVHWVSRWRLEKKDPAAALSEPVKPITFWLDKNIPQRYRAAVTAGILEWNKAFEKIGFKNAIVALQQPDDADFDTLDAEHASIRWFTGADVGFARGPSVRDPRSGEILDADIQMSDVFGRGARRLLSEDVGARTLQQQAAAAALAGRAGGGADDALCSYGDEVAAEMVFALELLEARGDIAPDSPEAEALAQAVVKDTITHEVGHTLGLKHNFRGSVALTAAQLRDKDYVDAHGLSASVMDYVGYNLPLQGEPRSELANPTIGAYDYWAIEYAYKPLAPAKEAEELKSIAERANSDPQLAFADDGDVGSVPGNEAIDPRVNQFDMGDDPLAWAERRMALSKELWTRVQQRGAQAGDDPQRMRRSVAAGLRQIERLPPMVAKYVGGMYTERDLPGTSSRPNYRPVEPERQRQAMKFLTDAVFGADSFRFKPEFLATLGPDYIEWERAGPLSVPQAVLGLQAQTLDRLMSAGTAQRLLELPYYLPQKQRAGAISLNEVYGTLQGAVWSELKSGAEIDPLRRNLQREHLRRVAALLTRGSGGLPADAASLLRMRATELLASLKQATAKGGRSVETRAHLQESLGLLTEALRATMQRG